MLMLLFSPCLGRDCFRLGSSFRSHQDFAFGRALRRFRSNLAVLFSDNFRTSLRSGFGLGGHAFSPFAFRDRRFATFQAGKVIIHGDADFFHRFRADAFNRLKLLRSHIGEGFHRGHARRSELLDDSLTQTRHTFQRSRSRRSHGGHLLLDFLPLLFLALDVDLPPEQLRGEAHVLPLLADGQRELAVVDYNFEMLLSAVDHGHAADLGGLQSLLSKRDRILVILNDVDLLAAQLADDRLHAHALHADAGADGVDVLVLRHDGDLRALPSFARDGANHDRAVINFWNFRLEQMLHEFRRGARDHDAWTF